MTREEQRARKAQQERMRQVERRHKEAARGQMDLPFLILTLLLTVIGLIMLFSASFPRAYYDTGDGTYYFKRQAAFAALGLVAMFIVSKINYQRWRGAGRLLVGLAFNAGMQNRANYTSRWYQVSRREMAVYEKLKVKRWKRGMPTYDPSLFDPRTHTWEEIVQATCQAELVHETIAVLSFLPIAAGVRFGAYPVFIITSVLAAACDMAFVIMQRYNRPRLIKLMELQKRKAPTGE